MCSSHGVGPAPVQGVAPLKAEGATAMPNTRSEMELLNDGFSTHLHLNALREATQTLPHVV
jgi:hypothetical protein